MMITNIILEVCTNENSLIRFQANGKEIKVAILENISGSEKEPDIQCVNNFSISLTDFKSIFELLTPYKAVENV